MAENNYLSIKVWIVGLPGAGKSFLAQRLANRLGSHVIEMDQIVWGKNWVKNSPESIARTLEKHFNTTTTWIMAGGYEFNQEMRASHSDVICYVKPSTLRNLWHLVLRTIEEIRNKTILWGGNQSTWTRLFSRDSILRYFIVERSKRDKELSKFSELAKKHGIPFVVGDVFKLERKLEEIFFERFER